MPRERAYRVEENWSSMAVSIVWAKNAEEAKRKVRDARLDESGDVEVLDAITGAEPKGIRVRREPSEDRDA